MKEHKIRYFVQKSSYFRRSRGGVAKLYGIKGECDHDMGIVSEGVGVIER